MHMRRLLLLCNVIKIHRDQEATIAMLTVQLVLPCLI